MDGRIKKQEVKKTLKRKKMEDLSCQILKQPKTHMSLIKKSQIIFIFKRVENTHVYTRELMYNKEPS